MTHAVVERLLTSHAARDTDALARCYTPDATVWPTGWPGPAPARAWVDAVPLVLESFPDLAFEPVHVVCEGPLAVLELRMTGTNLGPLHLNDADRRALGTAATSLPATGRTMSVPGVVVLELRDDLIAAERHYWLSSDALAELRPAEPAPAGSRA